jgi:outer membrane protein assembly factor BamB
MCEPAVSDDGVFVTSERGVERLSVLNGASLWKVDIEAGAMTSSVRLHGPHAFAGGGDGFVYAMEINSGRLVVQYAFTARD